MKELVIGKTYIKVLGDKVRLCADILLDKETKVYYFEMDQRYKEYLCVDRADPFVLALMYFALALGYNIRCTLPVTDQLLYQLSTYFIPIMVDTNDSMQSVSIIVDETLPVMQSYNKVVSSASGGVDSFYSIIKHLNCDEKFKITHLFVTNYFNIYEGEEKCRKRFGELKDRIKDIAEDLSLELYDVYTNMYDFWYPNWVGLSSIKYASCLYAVQSLFGVVYAPSSYEIKNITFKYIESLHYDLFNMKVLSLNNITFYSSGGESKRTEKIEYISKNSTVRNKLLVCNFETYNCSKCDKCYRTEMALYAMDKLDDFANVFDLSYFKRDKNKYWIKILRRRTDFDKENLARLSASGKKAPIYVIILAILTEPINWIKKLAEKSSLVEKLYYNTFIYKMYNGEIIYKLTQNNRNKDKG